MRLLNRSAVLAVFVICSIGSLGLLWNRFDENHRNGSSNDAVPSLTVEPREFVCPETTNPEGGTNQTATAEFEVSNRGTQSLHVDVDKNCGCLAVSPEVLDIPPGQKQRLRVDVRPPRVGRRIVTVTLLTNDPERPIEKLSIVTHGSTEPPLLVSSSSERIGFRDIVTAGAKREIQLETIEASGSNCWLTDAVPSSDILVIEDANMNEEVATNPDAKITVVKRKYTWNVVLASLPSYSRFEGRVDVLGGEGKEIVRSFLVLVERLQSYVASPSSVLLLDNDENELCRTVLIASRAVQPLVITELSTDVTWLAVSSSSSSASEQSRVVPIKVRIVDRPPQSFAKANVLVTIAGLKPVRMSVPVVYKRP